MEILSQIPIQLVVVLAGLAVTGVAYTFLSRGVEQAEARDTLRQVDGYDVTAAANAGIIDDQELQGSFMDRVGKKAFVNVGDFGRKFTPSGYIEKVRHKFIMAGRDSTAEVDRFIAMRVFALLAIPLVIVFLYVWNPMGLEGAVRGGLTFLLIGALIFGPDSKLDANVKDRQTAIMKDLPDVLDLLTISVEAGLGFEQALDRTIATVPGPLSTEFARMLGETRAGSSRADAMRALDARIDVSEVRSFVLAILQADTFGVSIGRVLRAQADEMRIRRRQLAQEQAQKAPVKMLIPMVFCIFPALFVVILVPAMIQIVTNF